MTETTVVLARLREMCRSGEAKAIRERADVSLSEVSTEAGTSPQCVSRWENGTRKPTGEAALRYAALLGRLQWATADARARSAEADRVATS